MDSTYGPAADYLVFRAALAGGPYTRIGSTAGVLSYVDSMPAHGTNYYVVVAENAGGSSTYSNETSALVP